MSFLKRSLFIGCLFAAIASVQADEEKKTIKAIKVISVPAVQVTPGTTITVAPAAPVAVTKDAKADDEKEQKQPTEQDIQKLIEEEQKRTQKALEEAGKLATHQLYKEVKVTSKDGKMMLQTLSSDPSGTIYALVAQPRGFSAPNSKAASEVHVLNQDGKEVDVINVGFHANSLNVGPDGMLYVAGDGKIAKYGKDRKMVGSVVELPHIAEILKDTKSLKEKAEKQLKAQKDSFAAMMKQYKERVDKLEAKKEDELTKTDKAQLKNLKSVLESFKESEKYYASMSVDSIVKDMTSRLRIINGVAVNEKDVFIVCGETEGYGFAIWRLETNLSNPKKIKGGVMGCCGQMDIQCCDKDLLVAENTMHRFAKYDRDGKELATGGKRGKETDPGCFGGCCNPMNVRSFGGYVYTAESEGIVKKFSENGEFRHIVGTVKISGGCKNVAIGANEEGSRIFFCDQPGSRVLILAEKGAVKKTENK